MITGNSNGEFTLWNGFAFNFETILGAHDEAVRAMAWSHNGNFFISGDNKGIIKYWEATCASIQVGWENRIQVLSHLSLGISIICSITGVKFFLLQKSRIQHISTFYTSLTNLLGLRWTRAGDTRSCNRSRRQQICELFG